MPFVPTYFAVVGDSKRSAVFELNGLDEIGHEAGDDAVFEVGRVLEGEGVVIVHHDGDVALAPDVEHGTVDDFG